jgi:hypothetical protein
MSPATEVELMRWRLLVADLTDRLEARARTLARTPGNAREHDRRWVALRHRLAQAQAAEPKANRS